MYVYVLATNNPEEEIILRRYFEGLYFKQQTAEKSIALIPAFHIDAKGTKSASIQIITDERAYCVFYSNEDFIIDRHKLYIKIGDNIFTKDGMKISIITEDISVTGELRFGKLSPLGSDIMGPFKFVPFMECRHSVFSMSHHVQGSLFMNNNKIVFDNGTGYIEGDRGYSFPKKYLWTHCSFENGSLMLSVAEIPFMGTSFTGIIGVVLLHGKEYRIATYHGAKVEVIKNGMVTVRQGKYLLTAKVLKKFDTVLHAPDHGSMTRLIREGISCTAQYSFAENGTVLLNLNSERASFEYEYEK